MGTKGTRGTRGTKVPHMLQALVVENMKFCADIRDADLIIMGVVFHGNSMHLDQPSSLLVRPTSKAHI